MPLNTQLADATVNVQADALAALCNGGLIRVYNGAQPATANTALSGNTLGVTLTFGNIEGHFVLFLRQFSPDFIEVIEHSIA